MIHPKICYLGWDGHGNLGDDAIRTSVEAAFVGARFIDLPTSPRKIAAAMATGLPVRLASSTLVVGGGTCIGRRNWRRHVSFGMAVAKGSPGYAIGVGVEDPSFFGRNSYSDRDELERWKRLLRKFRSVSVRGPLSAKLLEGIDVDASVVGDPALLLPRPSLSPVQGRIGVNLGFGDDLWGHDPKHVAIEMASACALLDRQGFDLVGVLMNRGDRQWLEQAFSGVKRKVEYVDENDIYRTVNALASCSVLVASRLHAAVLAAISGTPTVALEYQPKCRDFALSINNTDLLIRTDSITASRVIDQVNSAISDRDAISKRVLERVSHLQTKLAAAYDAARQEIGLKGQSEIRRAS
jgi:hypothetical protein